MYKDFVEHIERKQADGLMLNSTAGTVRPESLKSIFRTKPAT